MHVSCQLHINCNHSDFGLPETFTCPLTKNFQLGGSVATPTQPLVVNRRIAPERGVQT